MTRLTATSSNPLSFTELGIAEDKQVRADFRSIASGYDDSKRKAEIDLDQQEDSTTKIKSTQSNFYRD